FSKYRISDALMTTYKLIWDDFCSWLLEAIKPGYQAPIDALSYREIIALLEGNLRILHPFMPFLTEEIWQKITERSEKEALIIGQWPEMTTFDSTFLSQFALVKEVVSNVRNIRKEKNISFKNTIDLSVINAEQLPAEFDSIIRKMGNIAALNAVDSQQENALSFRVKSNEYFIPMDGHIDVEAEIDKLEKELSYNQGFLKSVDKKLSNARFVDNAPEAVVAKERQKQADAKAKIEAITEQLKNLN